VHSILHTGYDTLRRDQLSPWQHRFSPLFTLQLAEDSLINFDSGTGNYPAWARIKKCVKVTGSKPLFYNPDSHQQIISPNQNYI
jgi:hypothetical protein